MAELTTPFTPVFDQTFQSLLPPAVNIAVDPCRMEGILLHWLTLRGWCTYLFRGNADSDFDVQSKGTYQQASSTIDSQRIGQQQLLVRAGSLTETQATVLQSIYLSSAVFALTPGSDGKIKLVRVYIEPGTFAIWRDASSRMNIEVRIVFPTVKSQRT